MNNNEEQHESVWSKAIPFKEQVDIFKRLMGFVKQFKFEMIVALVGAFIVSVINILLPRGLQYFLDHFLLHQSTTVQVILFAGFLYALGSILKAIIQFTYQYFFALGSEKTLESVRKALYRKLHKLGMRYFDQTPAGSIVSRVTNDTMTLSNFLTVLSTFVIGAFSVITALVAMFTTNIVAGWLILLFIPILLLVVWLYSQKSSRLYRNYRERLSRINANLNESIEGVSVIQEFNQEKRMTNNFEGEKTINFETEKETTSVAITIKNTVQYAPIKLQINNLYINGKEHPLNYLYLPYSLVKKVQSILKGYASVDKPWMNIYQKIDPHNIDINMSIYQMLEKYSQDNLNSTAMWIPGKDLENGLKIKYKTYLEECNYYTLGDALESYIENATWKTKIDLFNEKLVTVSGQMIYYGEMEDVVIIYAIRGQEYQFKDMQIDGKSVGINTYKDLIEFVCD